jgi:hypothetical protein
VDVSLATTAELQRCCNVLACQANFDLLVPILQINFTTRASNIIAPMMCADRIFLIDIDLKELIMDQAFEILIPGIPSQQWIAHSDRHGLQRP